jgi:hypothetical protein
VETPKELFRYLGWERTFHVMNIKHYNSNTRYIGPNKDLYDTYTLKHGDIIYNIRTNYDNDLVINFTLVAPSVWIEALKTERIPIGSLTEALYF